MFKMQCLHMLFGPPVTHKWNLFFCRQFLPLAHSQLPHMLSTPFFFCLTCKSHFIQKWFGHFLLFMCFHRFLSPALSAPFHPFTYFSCFVYHFNSLQSRLHGSFTLWKMSWLDLISIADKYVILLVADSCFILSNFFLSKIMTLLHSHLAWEQVVCVLFYCCSAVINKPICVVGSNRSNLLSLRFWHAQRLSYRMYTWLF